MSSESHKHTVNGKPTPTYISYNAMKQRCNDPARSKYKYYGGIGIKVCDRWQKSFLAFLSDMGERPPNTSLDRIDPAGDYEPNNCRWAEKRIQNANRKNSLSVVYKNRNMTVTELSAVTGVPKYNLYKWVKRGYDLEVMTERFYQAENLHDWNSKDNIYLVATGRYATKRVCR
jgi:hypothetical protein